MSQSLATRTDAPKPQIVAGASVAAIVPRTLDEAFRLAQAISISGLAPKSMDKPEQIMVAIMAGAELGLAPFQAIQSFAVINNRPTLWGDALVAVVLARGVRVRERIEGEEEAMIARCEVERPDTGEVIERTFSVADARKAGLWAKSGPWQSYPKRMLAARARAFALRDGCADMLRGVQVREEVEDYGGQIHNAPQASGLADRMAQRQIAGNGGFSTADVDGALADAAPVSDVTEDADTSQVTPTEDVADEGYDFDAFLAGEAEAAEKHQTAAPLATQDVEVRKTLTAMNAGEDVLRRWATIHTEAQVRIAKATKGKRP